MLYDATLTYVFPFLSTRQLFQFAMTCSFFHNLIQGKSNSHVLQQHWWNSIKGRKYKSQKRNYLQDIVMHDFKQKNKVRRVLTIRMQTVLEKEYPMEAGESFDMRLACYTKYIEERARELRDEFQHRLSRFHESYVAQMQALEQKMWYLRTTHLRESRIMIMNERFNDSMNTNYIRMLRRCGKQSLSGHCSYFSKRISELRKIQSQRYSQKRANDIYRLERLIDSTVS